MKKILLLSFFLFTSACSLTSQKRNPSNINKAPEKVFTGSDVGFSDRLIDSVSASGIMFDAFLDGYTKCTQEFRLCELKNIEPTYLKKGFDSVEARNRQAMRYSVVLFGHIPVGPEDYKTKVKSYERSSSIASDQKATDLIKSAAKHGALARALNDCYADGNEMCFLVYADQISLTEVDELRYDDVSGVTKYFTSARAVVAGLAL